MEQNEDLTRAMTPEGDLDDEIPENELEAEPRHEDFPREEVRDDRL